LGKTENILKKEDNMANKNYDVLIVGGGPAGIITGVTSKTYYPDKSVAIVRKENKVLVPCGIPYILHTLESPEKDIIPDEPIIKKGIDIIIDEVIKVNIEDNFVLTGNGDRIDFEKIVFATGSTPTEPQWLEGRELDNVFYIKKDMDYLSGLKEKLKKLENIVIVGGGFIGVEVADEIKKDKHKKVTIVEKLPHILYLAFDEDCCVKAEEDLRDEGVDIITGKGVSKIEGVGKVEKVILEDNSELKADAVILSLGYKPNTKLAEKAGVRLGHSGAIWVDEYLRTDFDNVFAVGDCVERKDFITRRISNVMLASTATSEARIAGANLFKLQVVKTFTGTIGIFSTKIGNHAYGSAGISESTAKALGFDIVVGIAESIDKHPGSLPGAHKQKIKLIASRKSEIIMGAQVFGGDSTGELINLLGFAIQQKTTAGGLLISQIGTHPLLTSAPTTYPIIKAAENLISKL
jgi:NADPH-dependent 2,4-dienoyl-CoA reductase/sulfur reductase-like enzyme